MAQLETECNDNLLVNWNDFDMYKFKALSNIKSDIYRVHSYKKMGTTLLYLFYYYFSKSRTRRNEVVIFRNT